MRFVYGTDEQAFAAEVRTFAAACLPADIKAKVLTRTPLERSDYLRWQSVLHQRGWAAPHWPTECGGTGWNAVQLHLFEEELADAGAPALLTFGLNMCGPVIIKFGTPEQRAHFLPRILSGEHLWCQGYSEPGAGSDLASLRTRAVRRSDRYVVNGQKIWTTKAHWANWIFCLVRTDPSARKQAGISFLLIKMDNPGVTVRPITTLDGARDFNEVFFNDVEVPVENLIGEENKGWTYAKYLLTHERSGMARVGDIKRELTKLKNAVQGDPAASPRLRQRVTDIEIDLLALEATKLRLASGGSEANLARSSILKITATEIQQRMNALQLEVIRRDALTWSRDDAPHANDPLGNVTRSYLIDRKLSIYGGSNEIQRNILARAVLGMGTM